MGALPRPDVPAGPHRDLVEALHALHHRAGWPSLRTLARAAGVSHTTVSKVLSTAAVPSWGTLEVLVDVMGGDTDQFRQLWWEATTRPDQSDRAEQGARIVGRQTELAVLRRHMTGPGGLVLVMGEAGIGKTTLVEAAVAATDTCVCAGHCLPLSAEVPLMPIADVLRAARAVDDGRWMGEAVATCGPHVSRSLAPLLPWLPGPTEGGSDDVTDAFARHRLFTSVVDALSALGAARPLTVLLEDLHWSDGATLDLLEHAVARGLSIPVLATWRTEDPDVSPEHDRWLARLRRHRDVVTLELPAFTRSETAEQLRLTGPAPDDADLDRIHSLSQGLPLYTDQLAASTLRGGTSGHLADLLDLKLGDLSGAAWQLATVMALAGRPLPTDVLRSVTGLTRDEQLAGLGALSRRRLIRTAEGDRAALVHPLLGDAVRRRLLPGEAAGVHADLAAVLGRQPGAEPGEVARHWQHADQPDQEVAWRWLAARRARDRFARAEALDHLNRVLELRAVAGLPPGVHEWEVFRDAIDLASALTDVDSAKRLADQALALDLDDVARISVLERAGHAYCRVGDVAAGLGLLDEARDLVTRAPASPDMVSVLITRIGNLVQVGRHHEAAADIECALELLAGAPHGTALARVLMWQAWLTAHEGDHDRAQRLVADAYRAISPGLDPVADLMLAANATDILLHTGAPTESLEQTAAPALAAAAAWHLEGHVFAVFVRANLAESHLRHGDVERSAHALEPDVRNAPTSSTAASHVCYALTELLGGDTDAALRRCAAADAVVVALDLNEAEVVPRRAEIELWTGHPDTAATRLERALSTFLSTDAASSMAPLLTQLARARADLLDRQHAGTADRNEVLQTIRELSSSAHRDPFSPGAPGALTPAWTAMWRAEIARVEGVARTELWTTAATAWDRLRQPHEAAYCRWRAAEVACAQGQGTLGRRLLARAAADARHHAPLARAIAASSAAVARAAGGPAGRPSP